MRETNSVQRGSGMLDSSRLSTAACRPRFIKGALLSFFLTKWWMNLSSKYPCSTQDLRRSRPFSSAWPREPDVSHGWQARQTAMQLTACSAERRHSLPVRADHSYSRVQFCPKITWRFDAFAERHGEARSFVVCLLRARCKAARSVTYFTDQKF